MEQFDSFSTDILDETTKNAIEARSWVQDMKGRVMQITEKSILNWCNIVIKLGENDINLEEWVEIFEKQVNSLYNDLEQDINGVREKTLDSTEQLYKRLCVLLKELRIQGDPIPNFEQMSLYKVKKMLTNKIKEYETIYEARSKEYNQLVTLESVLCKALGSVPKVTFQTPLPTTDEMEDLKKHVQHLDNEKNERLKKFFKLKTEILTLMEQLEIEPKLSYEKEIAISEIDPMNLISETKMKQFEYYCSGLKRQLENVETEIVELRQQIETIWNQLEVDMLERSNFSETINGKSLLVTLEALKNELAKCKELKKANIKKFVDKLRRNLEELWLKCRLTDGEKQFQFYNSDCYTEDLLEIHERELEKLNNFYEENKEMFHLLDEFDELISKQISLELNDGNKDRYHNRGGQLLKEERERNKILKRSPLIENKLLQLSSKYLKETNKLFLIAGKKTIEHYILEKKQELEQQRKLKTSSAKKQQAKDVTTATPKKLCKTLFGTAGSGKRTPSTEQKTKRIGAIPSGSCSTTKKMKIRRASDERKERIQKRKQLIKKMVENENKKDLDENAYDTFADGMIMKDECRSTAFFGEMGVVPVQNSPLKNIENRQF